ncbi:hypothetical protein FALCPG4_015043 [Fusarium falciforme]
MNVPPRTILVLRAGTAQRTLTRANRSLLVLLVLSVSFWELNRQLKRANADPDDAWRTAAQRASQQLRACGSGAALPATPGPAPALASFGEIAEKSPEERKIMALETIAEAARLWIVSGIKSSNTFSLLTRRSAAQQAGRGGRGRGRGRGQFVGIIGSFPPHFRVTSQSPRLKVESPRWNRMGYKPLGSSHHDNNNNNLDFINHTQHHCAIQQHIYILDDLVQPDQGLGQIHIHKHAE